MRKYILIAFFPFFFLFSSCIKEKYKLDLTGNTDRIIAEFTNGSSTDLHTIAMDISITSFVEVDLAELRLLPRSSVSKDIHVTIALNPTLVGDYNAANGTAYNIPDNTVFQLPAVSFTLSPSSRTAMTRIRINPSTLTGNSYALGISISAISEGEISTIKKDYIVEIKGKNPYEGNYHATGVRTRYNGPTIASGVRDNFPIDLDKDFLTFDPTSVIGEAADAGSGLGDGLILTVDPVTNLVTITYIGAGAITPGSLVNQPGFTSTYDPVTKTFDLYYWYVNPNLRTVHETLVLN